ncbi:hypothetical protein E4U16_006163 [Claviceps sp. LM84 group G4]|nr:hypothetical protein E4U16_006163 [Claviceps sp. LM84 group G4]
MALQPHHLAKVLDFIANYSNNMVLRKIDGWEGREVGLGDVLELVPGLDWSSAIEEASFNRRGSSEYNYKVIPHLGIDWDM